MFRVKFTQIPEDKPLAEEGLELSLGELGLSEPFLPPGAVVGYELRRIHGKVLAKLKAEARAALSCSRCTEDFEAALKADFLAEFEPMPEDPNPRNLDPDDPGLNAVLFSGEDLDLGEEIRQELELQLPYAPLCRPDCRGLCPRCGKNWNQGPCACGPEKKDGPFAGLEKLFKERKEKEDA